MRPMHLESRSGWRWKDAPYRPVKNCARAGLVFLLGAGVTMIARPAFAQPATSEEFTNQAQTLTPDDPSAPDGERPPSMKADLVVAPIPLSNPALGTGLAVAAVYFYNPNRSPQPWSSGAGGGYTTTDSWFVGAFHKMSLADDRIRFLGIAGYVEANLDFYGVGPAAREAGVSIELHDKAFGGFVDTQFKPIDKGLLRHFHIGARLSYVNLRSAISLPADQLPDIIPPEIERRSETAMIGPSFTFDSLDDALNPRKGVNVTGTLLYGADWLGSDFTHHKLQVGANTFFPLGPNTVLGLRQQLCNASADAPYFDLCMFGQGADLRGYEAGRYRDGASWALQAEIRQHLAGKFGVVVFGGFGGIAEDVGAIWEHSKVLAAGGLGLRYLASESANVNLRADVAYGQDGFAFYFGIGEAF